MSTKLEDRWTAEQDTYLRESWGHLPCYAIAHALGRTEMAILVRRKRLDVPTVGNWKSIMLSGEFAEVLQVDRKSAWLLLKREIVPSHTVYQVNTPLLAINIKRFQRWLGDPLNWSYMDVSRITDIRFSHIIQSVQSQWKDE